MTAGSREQEVIDKLNGIWFSSFKLHANIQCYHKESKASSSRSLPKPRVPSVSVSIRLRDTRSYPIVVCTANGTYGDLAIPKNEIKSDSMPLITHDPDEGEILWIKNSLVELINEGVNYRDTRKSLVMEFNF